jgi:hypothetical protein
MTLTKPKPHYHKGSIDDDCKTCGYSVYMEWHKDGFAQTPYGRELNKLARPKTGVCNVCRGMDGKHSSLCGELYGT